MNGDPRRFLPWIGVAAVVGVVFIAYSLLTGGENGAAPSTTSTTAAEETTTTAGALPPAGPLGAVTVAPGQDIQIRSLQAVSGAVAQLGVPVHRATETAIAHYGMIKGHGVAIGAPIDDQCNEQSGRSGAAAIAADATVVAIVGPTCSGAAAGAAPVVAEAGLVMVATGATSEVVDGSGPGHYRLAHRETLEAVAAATFLHDQLGLTRAAAIHGGDPYSRAAAEAFDAAFAELGGVVVALTAAGGGMDEVTVLLTDVAAEVPQAIYAPVFMPVGGLIAQQAVEVEGLVEAVMVGGHGLLVDDFLALPESEGWYLVGPDLRFGENASTTGTTAGSFLADYGDRHGEAPSGPFWAHGYDATILLLTAVDEIAVELEDGSLFIDHQQLREALDAISGLGGITGTLTCDASGDCGAARVQISLHEDSGDLAAGRSNVVFEYAPAS